jgi:hypothetical protein
MIFLGLLAVLVSISNRKVFDSTMAYMSAAETKSRNSTTEDVPFQLRATATAHAAMENPNNMTTISDVLPSTNTNTTTTTTAWCILDKNNTKPSLFSHFPHTAEHLLPCWSYFLRVREQHSKPTTSTSATTTTEPGSIQCGFWLDSRKLHIPPGWAEDLVASMDCVVTSTRPEKDEFMYRPPHRATESALSWFQYPADAASLREKIGRGNIDVDASRCTKLRIGLVQRRGSRKILNLHAVETSLQNAYSSNNSSTSNSCIETVYMEDMTFQQQANWWSRQDVVVIAHGAGVTNVMFMQENASLVEIYPEHYYPLSMFTTLCQSVGVSHFGWYNGVADPAADYLEHGGTRKGREHYRGVDLTPPVEEIVKLVQKAVNSETTRQRAKARANVIFQAPLVSKWKWKATTSTR